MFFLVVLVFFLFSFVLLRFVFFAFLAFLFFFVTIRRCPVFCLVCALVRLSDSLNDMPGMSYEDLFTVDLKVCRLVCFHLIYANCLGNLLFF